MGTTTTFGYDSAGRLTTMLDGLSQAHAFAYDSMGRRTRHTDPLLKKEEHTYDVSGNRTSTVDRRHLVTTRTFDALDRLSHVAYADGSTVTRTYDAGNRLTGIVDSTGGSTTRTYDGFDRLLSETTPQGSVSYTYDLAGRRSTMTVSGQPTVGYDYDDADRLIGITQGTASIGFTYDDASRPTVVTLANGVTVEHGYDLASQVVSLVYKQGATVLGDLTYGYDLAGRRIEIGGSFARTGLPQAVNAAVYDAANRLTHWGGASLSYDDDGNLASDGPTSLAWNARNRLVEMTGATSGAFQYDFSGRRTGKTTGGQTTQFLYDEANIVQEIEASNPSANYLTGLGMDRVFLRTDTTAMSFLRDGLGNTLALADATGELATQYTYEAFGATSASGPATGSSLQFTGRENDSNGLYFYRARYYSPTLGRFISEDPLGIWAGPNVYAYVDNNPVNLVDPTGLGPIDCFRAQYWNRQCAKSGLECKKKLKEKYPDLLDLCLATNTTYEGAAYFQECWKKNPDCQKSVQAGAECSVFPHGGLLKLLIAIFR